MRPARLLLVLGGLAACACPWGASLDDPESHLPSDDCDALPIFEESCAGGLCHSTEDGEAPLGGLDLFAPGLAARLYDRPASYENVDFDELPSCPTNDPELLVDASNVDESLLLKKLLGTHACGDAMPIPNPPTSLTNEQIACVRAWALGVIRRGPPGSGGSSSGGQGGGGGEPAHGGAATGGDGTGGATGGSAPGGNAGEGGGS